MLQAHPARICSSLSRGVTFNFIIIVREDGPWNLRTDGRTTDFLFFTVKVSGKNALFVCTADCSIKQH